MKVINAEALTETESVMEPNRGGGFEFVIDPKTLIQCVVILGTGYYTSTEAIDSIRKLINEGLLLIT